jgi:deoxyribonuclease V
MEIKRLHPWEVTVAQARDIQAGLSGYISAMPLVYPVKLIAGLDVSISRFEKMGRAAAIIVDYPSMELVDVQVSEGPITFPYVPGLLSFREAPLALAALEKLRLAPDLVLVDGQGLAHPRRLGLASHLGLCLDIPTIGCAKSRLIGTHREVPAERGCHVSLYDDQEVIGEVVRTKTNVKPMYISVGHKIDLTSAVQWVLQCSRDYRLPVPTRLAHLAAKGAIRSAPTQRYTY